jgi:segregation and condensation protein B
LGITELMLATAVEELHTTLATRGLTLVETDSDLELRVAALASPFVAKLHEAERARELGKAALEVLAIIIYQNGATRSDIDWLRGVNSTAALRSLTLRGLVESGEDTTDRRRTRYTASIDALAHLGISKGSDLPNFSDISRSISSRRELEQQSGEVSDIGA